MTSEHQMYGRFLHPEESEQSLSGHTSSKGIRSIETVNDMFKELKADSYQEGYLLNRVGAHQYQQESKYEGENYRPIISLLGSFLVMSMVSFVGCNHFPSQSKYNQHQTPTGDIAPIVTPMHMMGFN